MKHKTLLIAGLLAFTSVSATVVDESPPGEEIRIFADGETEIREYRSHGHVYMIKITPKKGLPYFLVDADGDGDFDTRHNDLAPDLKIPSWVIFSW